MSDNTPEATAVKKVVAVAAAEKPATEFAPYTFPRYRQQLDALSPGIVLVTARSPGFASDP
jgi:hypothetical protein